MTSACFLTVAAASYSDRHPASGGALPASIRQAGLAELQQRLRSGSQGSALVAISRTLSRAHAAPRAVVWGDLQVALVRGLRGPGPSTHTQAAEAYGRRSNALGGSTRHEGEGGGSATEQRAAARVQVGETSPPIGHPATGERFSMLEISIMDALECCR